MREAYDYNPNRSYYTVEDPVEVKVPNFYQIEINAKAGVTFPNALRALLRADPDVILVGEIRDFDTAKLAIQASLTGHLVFSTLHTNGAIETISRMLDLGIDARLLADSLIAVSAQRMVRRLCQSCAEKKLFKETEYYAHYHKATLFDEHLKPILALEPEDNICFVKIGADCKACGGQGYKGRHQISELFTRDAELQRLITDKRAPADILEYLKKHQHFENMWQHGFRLVRKGITTFSELESHLEPFE
jgi:type II secretory ATPase GspE/PulE/Tfp pilus assembly ATPase PilB-like protein